MQATTNATDSSVMTPPSMPFRLMDLPGELRNMIYYEYFNSFSTEATENTNDTNAIDDSNKSLHALQPFLNILHANREVRSEAASIFYEEYINKPSGQSSSHQYPRKSSSNGTSRDLARKPRSNA